VSYTLSAGFGVLGAIVLDLAVLRTRLVRRAVFWTTYPIVLVFQLIFNGVLTGRGVVVYRADAIAGPRLFWAPLEDLGFGFALVLSSLALWVWWGRHGVGRSPAEPPTRPPRR
jgi:lycopene cyclase domain-containing protein